MTSPAYLSVCAIFRDEGPYLREWIEFHKLVGVERFFLYDNVSVDDSRDVLAPYLRSGDAVVHECREFPGQIAAYRDCLSRHAKDSRWIAFIDIDEFLFSPTGRGLPEVLAGFEAFPAIGVNWINFGTSGHVTKPPGLVIESYVQSRSNPLPRRVIKSIVDPRRVASCASPHHFLYVDGWAVDENKRPINGPDQAFTDAPSTTLLRVNHYVTKSEQERREKLKRRRADTGELRPRLPPRPGEIKDETILMYVPRLRKVLAAHASTK